MTGLEQTTGTFTAEAVTSSVQAPQTLVLPSAGIETGATTGSDAPYLVLNPLLYGSSSHRLGTGIVLAFAGTKIPSGWLLADGRAISRTDYAPLFAVIGTTFGAGDGAATFNLPDLRGRTVLGKADNGPAAQFASFGGTLDHAHGITVPDHAHVVAPAAHTHNFHFPYHVHSLGHTQIIANDDFAAIESARGVTVQVNGGGGGDVTSAPGAAPATSTGLNGGGTFPTGPANAPYLVMRYIIRT